MIAAFILFNIWLLFAIIGTVTLAYESILPFSQVFLVVNSILAVGFLLHMLYKAIRTGFHRKEMANVQDILEKSISKEYETASVTGKWPGKRMGD